MGDEFINRLMSIMEALHMAPGTFAGKLGIKPSVVYAWRDGRNKPGWELLQKISITFAININWLVTGEGEMFLAKSSGGPNNFNAVSEPEANYPDYQLMYEQALARISLLEKTIADKEEIIELLKERGNLASPSVEK